LQLPLTIFKEELLTELNVAPAQPHPNSYAFIRAFPIICSQFCFSPTVEVFLYFFETKRLGRQLWVSFNGVSGRALLSLFQSSYKKFKEKFLKLSSNKCNLTLLNGFPLYWTEKPRFQGVRRLKDMPTPDQEICKFLSNLKVVFDTARLIREEFSPKLLKIYTGTSHSLPPMRQNFIHVLIIHFFFFAENVLSQFNKKKLVEKAKRMKAVSKVLKE